jgi:MFS transporter, DHA1 family, inner membrane transport protein
MHKEQFLYAFSAFAERRLLWLLALTQFTVIMDFMVMMPLGPQIMHAFRISPAAFATAVSAYSWCSGLSGLLAATYIDRFNRRTLLLAMYGLFALSNLACAFSGSFNLLLLSRAFAGLSGGVIGSLILAIIGDVIPPQRRGAATGTVMIAFSMAAVIGVPAGIALGAHYGWGAPFFLLFALSLIIGLMAAWIVPSLSGHLKHDPPPYSTVLPQLWHLISTPAHRRAYVTIFVMMVSQMIVIPFISPILVANHGVAQTHLAWIYVAGGLAPFFFSRYIGRLSDRYGHRRIFRVMLVYSLIPVLFITHLPQIPFWVLVILFPFFMIAMTGRMVPLQALLITVPKPAVRGAFLSANSSFLALGSGFGAWVGGLMLSNAPDGSIVGYGNNGLLAAALALFVFLWVSRVKSNTEPAAMQTVRAIPLPNATVGASAAVEPNSAG